MILSPTEGEVECLRRLKIDEARLPLAAADRSKTGERKGVATATRTSTAATDRKARGKGRKTAVATTSCSKGNHNMPMAMAVIIGIISLLIVLMSLMGGAK